MNVVVIVPTGIGAKIGGGCGDASPVVKLLASVCDIVVTHPNVVNGADINEIPHNAWYVEGSILDRFLDGSVNLKRPKANRILVVSNDTKPETLNSIGAARATIGVEIEHVQLNEPLLMSAYIHNGFANGRAFGVQSLITQVKMLPFDALAIHSEITTEPGVAIEYMRTGSVNPWGKIESRVSRTVATAIDRPTAHAPIESDSLKMFNEVVDDSKASEMVSVSYLHCVLKGLATSPRIGGYFHRDEIDALVTPHGCIGPPHRACFDAGIPVIGVKSNPTSLTETDPRIQYVENYLEVAGMLAAMKAGMNRFSSLLSQ